MLERLPPAYLRIAEKVYGRKFTSDTDLISALQNETFPKRSEFLTIMTNSLGYEFTSPLEVFRLAADERLADFEPLSPPPGAPTPLEVAKKSFSRDFATPKDLSDFIDAVPTREMTFQDSLIAAGWRAKKRSPIAEFRSKKPTNSFPVLWNEFPWLTRIADLRSSSKRS